MGFDVDVVNSVQFSNHTGHPLGVEGDVLNGEQLRKVLDGLNRNGLLNNIGHLLTGYIGSESFLRAVLDVLKTVKSCRDPLELRYVCDPVLGDNGTFYVPRELVEIYRDEVIPLADIVTPNQFEVEQLTGVRIKCIGDAQRACKVLHDMGPELVFITSLMFDDDTDDTAEKDGEGSIAILASRRAKDDEMQRCECGKKDEVWRIDSPIIHGTYTGTGDLCAALLLGWTARHDKDLPLAMEKVVGTMFELIKRTADTCGETVSSKELKLIQSKDIIEQPPILYKAQQIQ
mmetsp:Transcript_28304/g.83316  ORF Transcript_28304/g.83316 Transcript_28304/m.83316 type:complete len:288 (-) Transcript_28304:99-962(-)